MSERDCQRIDHDLECVNCGYNLRTRSWNERCPECGTAVVLSLRRRRSAPPYGLSAGLTAAGVGVVLVAFVTGVTLFGVSLLAICLFVGLACELAAFGLSVRSFRRLRSGVRWTSVEFVAMNAILLISMTLSLILGSSCFVLVARRLGFM